ncbi:hypothetical protein G7046_g2869 [Stylonectria norvegica]|nr:hypothetical protein G7046_g2869 [Stylonectria norvegica]
MRSMPIIRSRTGCFTCRRRKKKCNEEKPTCSGCRRNSLDCHWPVEAAKSLETSSKPGAPASVSAGRPGRPGRPFVVPASERQQEKQRQVEVGAEGSSAMSTHSSSASSRPEAPSVYSASPTNAGPGSDADMADADDESGDEAESPPRPHSSSSSSAASAASTAVSPSLHPDELNHSTANAVAVTAQSNLVPGINHAQAFTISMPMPMTMLPQHDHHSYELLSYYLSRTANSMGNGSTEVNPFIAKLVPLAFSNPLVLQLILAQSAAHREASDERQPNSDEIAQRYYTDSLRMFRNVVGEYVAGKEGNTLVLTVGSLILCLTEVARGDIHGTIFDHLTASKSLLSLLLTRPKSELCGDLPDFLVEYYMHMAASSMISIDPHYSSHPLLSPDIEQLARGLLAKNYVGQLCGCWLELLILIPQIFHLGQNMMPTAEGQPVFPSADDILTFGFLQSQVLAFFPDPSVSQSARLAGLVFKQAVILYLWSILGSPYQKNENGTHQTLIHGAVSDAISLLSQFPASVRVNTSLCWPLAVIGCCTSDPDVQQILRTRLQTMLDTIGLGNMRQTLVLLEHIWKQPPEETSPWTLCKAMREHQIWISFA